MREEEREHDAKRLKEFLEDYDDERDDVKYYKYKIKNVIKYKITQHLFDIVEVVSCKNVLLIG